MKDKIGRWIGNILIFASILSILYVYFNLYKYGHLQCSKSDLENRTFLISTLGYALIFVIAGSRLSASKNIEDRINKIQINRKLLVVIGAFFGVIFMIIYLLIGFKIQNIIEESVDNNIKTQLKTDGVPIIGFVEKSYSKNYNRRHSKIQKEQIEFKYNIEGKTVYACYSLGNRTENNFKLGDTLNFIISKSKPEYILLKE